MLHQKIIENLCSKLEIPDLKAGNLTIRDELGWRINEKRIGYSWLVNISNSFTDSCWLFSIQFNKSAFRKIQNPEQLIQGIFTVDGKGDIIKFHMMKKIDDMEDKVKSLTSYDMFDANLSVTLNGIIYKYLIFAPNTEIRMTLNNPHSKNWRIWENEIQAIGKKLSQDSDSETLKKIFDTTEK
ncbi:hypothetical protein FUAX_51880 (plasmid) [Fulvitalea axinellae]|uniref:DUF4304 domain-containing protein n=1 Tax=Fulvitalea axinellae TaxID=1182444 RepID=A0AAU9CL51_9BACT|nr:hypothetical protein FUAX_51880 [Fulvitalea axinellae]